MKPDYVVQLAPVPKKNGNQIYKRRDTGKPFVSTSDRYKQYAAAAPWFLRPVPAKPIDYPINIKYLFYVPDMRRRDASNLIEAIDDILQDVGIIKDDCWQIVAGHDGTRVYLDRENPRTEIYIERMTEDG